MHVAWDSVLRARSFTSDLPCSAPCFQAGPCPPRPCQGASALEGHVAFEAPSLRDPPPGASTPRPPGHAWARLVGVLLPGLGHGYPWAPPCLALSPAVPVLWCVVASPHFLWLPDSSSTHILTSMGDPERERVRERTSYLAPPPPPVLPFSIRNRACLFLGLLGRTPRPPPCTPEALQSSDPVPAGFLPACGYL